MVGEINQPISPGKRLSLSVRYIGKIDYDSRLSLTHKLIIKIAVIYTGEIESLNNKKKLLEVLKLTEIEQWIREEGREEEQKVIAIS